MWKSKELNQQFIWSYFHTSNDLFTWIYIDHKHAILYIYIYIYENILFQQCLNIT